MTFAQSVAKKLEDLSDYLNRNQAECVNYQEQDQQGHNYTSQVAESQLESIINALLLPLPLRLKGLAKVIDAAE